MDRRGFLKTVGATGIGTVLAAGQGFGQNKGPTAEKTRMPKRKLGRSGIEVPVLGLGGHGSFIDRQILLRKAVETGVTYWDTSSGYANGNSELGIGKFIGRNPELRKKLFIATRAWLSRKPQDIEKLMRQSMERMQTDYFDLYYGIHRLKDPEAELNDDVKQWVKKMKKQGAFKLFGCTVHSNMAENLLGAARHGWVDVIMFRYNFRTAQDPKLQAGIEACHKAGIALVGMKTLGFGVKEVSDEEKKLIEHFSAKGFSESQAKIKCALSDERLSTACVGMVTVGVLKENVAAVTDKAELAQRDLDVLREYAQASCSRYCAGCSNICEKAVPEVAYVSDIMRYLMYYNSYGQEQRAKELFARIPANVKGKLLSVDYSKAQACCPNGMPIGSLVAEAVRKLA